jgi:asparagine synthase (glutamine-hydrolysing)
VPDDPEEDVLSLLQQVSLYETTGYMRNTLLRDSDVFSMAHGLELRVPFVDGAVARAAMSFPDSEKLSRRVSKPILVSAMQDLLPESLFTRPKQGFTLPFERWMRQELHPEIDTTLTSPELSSVGLSSSATARVWSDFQKSRGAVTWSRPWALYTLKRWADQNNVVFGRVSNPAALRPVSFAETR